MEKWKVSYNDLQALQSKRPFSHWSEIVEASSKDEAIRLIKDRNYYGNYAGYKASKVKEN